MARCTITDLYWNKFNHTTVLSLRDKGSLLKRDRSDQAQFVQMWRNDAFGAINVLLANLV